MRKHIVAILFAMILFLSYIPALGENILVLPEKLMTSIVQDKNYKNICNLFISCSDNAETVLSNIHEYGENNENHIFSLENIVLDGVSYERIHGSYLSSFDGKLSYAISLEYKCPFGEEIDNSNVFINTVNAYEGLYKQIATPSNIREADAIRNSVTMCWEDQITGMHIVMTYRNGDIAKARFPEITIYIQGEI